MKANEYLTVSALTKYISKKFTYDPYLEKVYLVGEISNFRLRARHQYFSLKDDNAKIEAVMFQSNFKRIKFEPEDGMKVLVTGRIEVYEQTGKYQINIESMQPDGIGALYQAYEQLKDKLAKEGIFSREKRPLAKFPKRIAVITSPSGAVIRDIITTTRRRYPIVQLVLFPAEVQGEYAKDSLVKRLKEVNQLGNFDTIIIGRGGGSIEDLWPFNEEQVARAVADSKIPVISSVGHETDTTLTDLAADVRAATPTAAAELATPVLSDEILKIKKDQLRIITAMRRIIQSKKEILNKIQHTYIFSHPEKIYDAYLQKLDLLDSKLIDQLNDKIGRLKQKNIQLHSRLLNVSPLTKIKIKQQQIEYYKKQLVTLTKNKLESDKNQISRLKRELEILSPQHVVERGYTYVTVKDKILKNINDFEQADQATIHLMDGTVEVKILNVKRDE